MKKLLGILLSLVMIIGLMPGMSLTVWANEPVSYVEYTYSNGALSGEIKTVSDYTMFPDDYVNFEGISGWYVVNGNNVNAIFRIYVSGTLNLILCDGAKLNAMEGIHVGKNDTLNIYGQSACTGELYAKGLVMDAARCCYAAIGTEHNSEAGTINIHGGIINAQCDGQAAGIGGGYDYDLLGGQGGTVTIYNGNVTAISRSAAGIGVGEYAEGGSVTIYGGSVTAKGGISADGIGTGHVPRTRGKLVLGKEVKLYGDANTDPPATLLATGDGTAYTGDRFRYMKTIAEHKHGDITFTRWMNIDSLPDTAGNYYLTQDVDLGNSSWSVPSGTTNLCLNGHSITSADDDCAVLFTNENSTLNIYDDPAGNTVGMITNTEDHGVLLKGDNTTFNMYGGKISGDDDGVYLDDATGTSFNMYGGEISNCAYGVELDASRASFNMYGGKITGNTRGVYVDEGTFNISGSPKVTGNTNNVYLNSDQKINVTGELTEAAAVGVTVSTTDSTVVFTNGLSGKLPNGKTAADIFSSDENHIVSATEDGEAQLVKRERVATPSFSPAAGTYNATQTVEISCATDGATIYYTTDGTDPTTDSLAYSASITVSQTTTIKAKAVKTDMANSEIASAVYGIDVDPHGALDAVTGKAGSIDVAGWAFDPGDTTESVEIRVSIGGPADSAGAEAHNQIIANKERADVDSAYGCGDHHGFGETITTDKRGEQAVYVYAINIGEGKDVCLGNRTVTISDPGTTSYELLYAPGDGGTGSMDAETVTVGQEYTFPECTFDAPFGKTFDRWEMSGADGIYNPGSTVTIAVNCVENGVITVTAYWKDAPPAGVETAPQAKNLIFNGSAQKLVTEGKAENGTMQYVLGKDGATAPEKGWNTAIPTGTSAGTYYVWYKVKGDETHSDTTPKFVTVTISTPPVPVITIHPKVSLEGWTYGSEPNTPVVTGNTGNGAVAYTYKVKGTADSTYTDKVPTDAGEYTIRARIAATVRYSSGTAMTDFTISKASAPVSLDPQEKPKAVEDLTYNDEDQTLVIPPEKLPEGYEKVQYSKDSGTTWTDEVPTGKDAGDYTVNVRYAADKNHTDFNGDDVKVTIEKAAITGVNLKYKTMKYTGKALTQTNTTVVMSGDKILENDVDYKITYKNNVNVGTATMIIEGTGNYGGSIEKPFKITKANNTLTVSPTKKTVKQSSLKEAKSFTIRAKKAKGKVTYKALSTAKKAGIRVSAKGKVTIPKNCKKGTYKIKVKAAGNRNYKAASKTVAVVIIVK